MSDIKEIRLCGKVVEVAFAAYHIFGSGSVSCSAFINGARLTRAMCEEKGWKLSCQENGFWGFRTALIPFPEFLRLESLEFDKTAYPGGSFAASNTPKAWVEWCKKNRKFGQKTLPPQPVIKAMSAWYRANARHTQQPQPLALLAAKRLGWNAEKSWVTGDVFVNKLEMAPAFGPKKVAGKSSMAWSMKPTGQTIKKLIGTKDGMKMPCDVYLP